MGLKAPTTWQREQFCSATHLLAKDALAAGGLEPVELGLKRLG